MIKAKIFITLKEGILDPQGRAVQQSLQTLGFSSVQDVRIGKFLEVNIQENEKSAAETQIKSICERLLTNPVIENYRFELVDS